MTTVSMLRGTSGGKGESSLYAKRVRVVYQLVDMVKVETAAVATLALGDIIKVLRIPAGSVVLDAGAKVVEATNVSTFRFGVGDSLAGGTFVYVKDNIGDMNTTGFSTRAWLGTYVEEYVAGSYSVPKIADPRFRRHTSEGDIRVQVGTHTGTYSTAGVLSVYAIVAPIAPFEGENINATDQAGVPQA